MPSDINAHMGQPTHFLADVTQLDKGWVKQD